MVPGIEPRSEVCRASTLSAVLWLWPQLNERGEKRRERGFACSVEHRLLQSGSKKEAPGNRCFQASFVFVLECLRCGGA